MFAIMLNVLSISDQDFSQYISEAMDELPTEYITGLDNVAIVYEDTATADQKRQVGLHCDSMLFGLYEGISLTRRPAGYNLVLPDKITIFKHPMLDYAKDITELKAQIKHTLWHEIAHYYGLDHDRIHAIEANWHA